uniref:Uncharacterized protein n=1 Tax=Hyaloperonospora arabidopsidis (strain Emoy2) TaxID=559515 RepID=M4BZC6_HYAAE
MLFNQFLLAAVRNEATKSRKNNKGDRRMTWTNVPVATKIFDCMQEAQVATPDDFTFVTCMRRLENRGDWDDGFEIDLHTFSRGVAKCAVVSAFDEITHSQQSIGAASLGRNVPLQDLRIIVGLGKRSQTFMKPVLRQEITDLLTKSSWPPLWPSMHPTNPGVLLLSKAIVVYSKPSCINRTGWLEAIVQTAVPSFVDEK